MFECSVYQLKHKVKKHRGSKRIWENVNKKVGKERERIKTIFRSLILTKPYRTCDLLRV